MRVSSALIHVFQEDRGRSNRCSSLSLAADGEPGGVAMDPSKGVAWVAIDPSKGNPHSNRERRLIASGSPEGFRFIATDTHVTLIKFTKAADGGAEILAKERKRFSRLSVANSGIDPCVLDHRPPSNCIDPVERQVHRSAHVPNSGFGRRTFVLVVQGVLGDAMLLCTPSFCHRRNSAALPVLRDAGKTKENTQLTPSHDPARPILSMSWFSSTDFGAPRRATFSIARPMHSDVVTYFGKSNFHTG